MQCLTKPGVSQGSYWPCSSPRVSLVAQWLDGIWEVMGSIPVFVPRPWQMNVSSLSYNSVIGISSRNNAAHDSKLFKVNYKKIDVFKRLGHLRCFFLLFKGCPQLLEYFLKAYIASRTRECKAIKGVVRLSWRRDRLSVSFEPSDYLLKDIIKILCTDRLNINSIQILLIIHAVRPSWKALACLSCGKNETWTWYDAD